MDKFLDEHLKQFDRANVRLKLKIDRVSKEVSNRVVGVKAFRQAKSLVVLKPAIDFVDGIIKNPLVDVFELDWREISILSDVFDIVFRPQDQTEDLPQEHIQPYAYIAYGSGLGKDVFGNAKDLADAIYALLKEGCEAHEIHVVTPPISPAGEC